MAVFLSPVGGVAAQFFTNTGAVLTGGKLYTYAAGTTTPQTTYTTSAGNVARTNPIILDSAGRVPDGGETWVTNGVSYKFVLKDSNDVLIATYDNIVGIADSASLLAYEAAVASSTGSSLVGYTQGGTGAVATTVQAKLRQTVSVTDFGAVGNGTTDDYAAFAAAIAALPAKGGALYIPPTTTNIYRLSQTLSIRKPIHMYGDVMGANNTTGTTLYFDANVSGLVFGAYNTSLYTTITPDGALGSQYSILENLLILSAGGATTADGVVLRVQMTCRNVTSRGFKRYGFRIYNTIGGGGSIEGDGNQWFLQNCKAISNGDHGFYVDGNDSNTGLANKCFSQINGGYGFYDNSLIGNTYIGCDTVGNTTGSMWADRASAANTVIGLWEDDGSATSQFGGVNTIIGGNAGNPSTTSSAFSMFRGIAKQAPYQYINARGSESVSGQLGANYNDTTMTVQAFGATSEGSDTAWKFQFDATEKAWFLQYAASAAFTPIAYINSAASLYTLKGFTGPVFRNGYAVRKTGNISTSKVRMLDSAAPTTGTWVVGDIVYNDTPTAGGFIGWVCTTAGTPGTWKTFGAISA